MLKAETITKLGIDPKNDHCSRPWAYSHFMLEKVSRTFALNIAILPKKLKQRVLLSYLFCRMADTLEDDPVMKGNEKSGHLQRFSAIFSEDGELDSKIELFSTGLPTEWKNEKNLDRYLTAHAAWPLVLYKNFDPKDRKVVQQCVTEMCAGMEEYSLRKIGTIGTWMSLKDLDDLDRYCYFVAGTVGNLLCDLFLNASPFIGTKRHKKMRQLSVSFGLALQVTNIIKDVAEDSTRGICYVPESLVRSENISTRQLTDPAHREAAIRVMKVLMVKALAHLQDALDYTLLIPRSTPRIRLFCIWPLFMSLETLEACALRSSELLNPKQKVKITRAQVKNIITWSTAMNWSNRSICRRFRKSRERVLAVVGES